METLMNDSYFKNNPQFKKQAKAFTKYLSQVCCTYNECMLAEQYSLKYATEEEKTVYDQEYLRRHKIVYDCFMSYGFDSPQFEALSISICKSVGELKKYPGKYIRFLKNPLQNFEKGALQDDTRLQASIDSLQTAYESNIGNNGKISINKALPEDVVMQARLYQSHFRSILPEADFTIEPSDSAKSVRYVIILSNLRNLKAHDAVNYLFSEKVDHFYLQTRIKPFVDGQGDLSALEKIRLEKDLNEKSLAYTHCLNNARKAERDKIAAVQKDNDLKRIKTIILHFINGNQRKTDFCKSNQLAVQIFDNYIRKIKELDEDLYEAYKQKIALLQKNQLHAVCSKSLEMMQQIENGVVLPSGIVRPFDMLDYYDHNELSIPEFTKTMSQINLGSDSIDLKQRLYYANEQVTVVDKNTALASSYFLKMFTGEIHELTLEEKQRAYDFLKDHNIPITNYNYHLAMSRVINGYMASKRMQLQSSENI